ncbi:MAG TPA: hypothetical protein VK420_22780 [Longimicrobium sp.]|nr:hypothetical protein [Longimicrobium sp.]
MNNHINGQSGHPDPPVRYERSHRWQDIPVDILRAWYREQSPLRGISAAVAKLTGETPLAAETIRSFAADRVRPNRKTRRQLALYYLAKNPWGYVAEKGTPYGTPKPLPPLSKVLPAGHAAARAEIEKLVELAKRHPDEVPGSTDALRGWLEKMLDAEYTGEDLSKRPLDANGNPIPNDPPER